MDIKLLQKDFSDWTEGESQFGLIPRVSECVEGDCQRIFPQFRFVDSTKFFQSLKKAIQEFGDHGVSNNKDEQMEVYLECQRLPFPQAAALLYEKSNGSDYYFSGARFYVSVDGYRLLEYIPCCR